MATYYALPALVAWGTSGSTANGFSATSGGTPIASANTTSSDIVIFDNNSGPSRAIAKATGQQLCLSLTVASNAANFAFADVQAYNAITLNAGSSIAGILNCNGGNTPGTGTVTVTCNGGYIAGVSVNSGGFALGGTGNFGGLNIVSGSFVTNNYNFVATSMTCNNTGGFFTWEFGTSTVTINCSVPGTSTYDVFNGTSQALISGTPTIIFNIASTSNGLAKIGKLTSGVNLTINSPGPCRAYLAGSIDCNNISIRGNVMLSGTTISYAKSWSIDGNGAYNGVANVTSDAGTTGGNATINRSDSNVTYFDRVALINVGVVSQTGKAFYSRSDQGSGSGASIIKIPGNSRFIPFF